MTLLMTAPFLLVAVPVAGAALSLVVWNKPDLLKVWLLFATMATLGALGWAGGGLPPQAAGLPLLAFLPIMAFVSLLGQPLHRCHRSAWLLTLLLLGLALGMLAFETVISVLCFIVFLAVLALTLIRFRPHSEPHVWWGIGTLGLAGLASGASIITTAPIAPVAMALACAVALPLVPLHKGYLAALTTLPGNLPAFLAVVLPVMGFHGLAATLPQLPPGILKAIGMLALAGSLYGSLRALAQQSRAASVAAYGSLAFLSILWWYLADTGNAGPQTLVFLSATGLATSGLLLASFLLGARYGESSLRGLGGLAAAMPRFAIVLSLLALAAIGLPPFGLFAGFLGMLLAPSFHWSGGLSIVIVAWLAASWYVFDLVQGLLFGPPQLERRRHEDLRDPEFAALTVILVLLAALGIFPSGWFNAGQTPTRGTVVMGAAPWNR